MHTYFERMRPSYTAPTDSEIEALLASLKANHERGLLSFSATDVIPAERVPWDGTHHFVDVRLALSESARQRFFRPHACEKTYGSGTNEDLLAAVAHAASETLERLFQYLGGEKSLRPTQNSAFSLSARAWTVCDAAFAETHLLSGKSNSGSAFHVDEGEALRAALCEAIERDTVCRALLSPQSRVGNDVSEVAYRRFPKALMARDFWDSQGYDLEFRALPNEWGVWVILAYARQRNRRMFRAVFKGTSCDFTVTHAVEQALSELGRNAFMGPVVGIKTKEDLERCLAGDRMNPSVRDNLRLLSPEWTTSFHRFEDSLPLPVDACEERDSQQTPLRTLRHFENQQRDLWLIPVASKALGIPGYVYKFFAPGFFQKPNYSDSPEFEMV